MVGDVTVEPRRRRHGEGRAHHRRLPAAGPDRQRRAVEGRRPARRRRRHGRVRRDDPGAAVGGDAAAPACRRAAGAAHRGSADHPRARGRQRQGRRRQVVGHGEPRGGARGARARPSACSTPTSGASASRACSACRAASRARRRADGTGKIVPQRGRRGRRRHAAGRVDGAPRRRRGHRARCGAGLILAKALEQFLTDVRWGDSTTCSSTCRPAPATSRWRSPRLLPQAEMLVVTTPARARRRSRRASPTWRARSYMKVVGVVENMSEFVAPDGSTPRDVRRRRRPAPRRADRRAARRRDPDRAARCRTAATWAARRARAPRPPAARAFPSSRADRRGAAAAGRDGGLHRADLRARREARAADALTTLTAHEPSVATASSARLRRGRRAVRRGAPVVSRRAVRHGDRRTARCTPATRRWRSARERARRPRASSRAGSGARARAERGDGRVLRAQGCRRRGDDVRDVAAQRGRVPARVRRAGVALGARRRPLRDGRGARSSRAARSRCSGTRPAHGPAPLETDNDAVYDGTRRPHELGRQVGARPHDRRDRAAPLRRATKRVVTWESRTRPRSGCAARHALRSPHAARRAAHRLHEAVGAAIDAHGGARRRHLRRDAVPRDAASRRRAQSVRRSATAGRMRDAAAPGAAVASSAQISVPITTPAIATTGHGTRGRLRTRR